VQLHGVRLLVSDFAGCFRFYRDVMGMEPGWGDPTSTYADFRMAGATGLALFRRDLQATAVGTDGLPSQVPQQDRSLITFEVPDLDAAVAALTSRGARFVTAPRDYPDWTLRAAYLRDPDGNHIELFSSLPPDRWSAEVTAEATRYARPPDDSA